jgi:hypothetical protein
MLEKNDTRETRTNCGRYKELRREANRICKNCIYYLYKISSTVLR